MNYIKTTIIIFAFVILLSAKSVLAASTPQLSLTNGASTVNISVTGADPNATVNFFFPNSSTNSSNNITYTSIDIGQTDSSGSFSVSVAPNSYGLNGGVSVYVGVDNMNSVTTSWPASNNSTVQNGSLSLSQQTATMVNGQTTNIFSMNTSNTLSVQGNSNPSIASAYYQSSNNSVVITGQNVGSTTVSICAGTAGCSSVSISVIAPTQTITFSQSTVYLTMGNSAQTISVYGPGSGFSVSNSNQNILSTSVSGTNISLQGLALGQTSITVCASGWICGSLPVNIVSPGTSVPYQVNAPPSANSNFSQKPELTSFSMTSNDVMNLFFGANSTLTITFGVNQTVNNVQVSIAGQQAAVGQGSDGTYSASYRITGNETMPLPVVISYTNPSGLIGQNYFWIGNSATLPTSSSASTPSSSCPAGLTCTPSNTTVTTSGLGTFTSYLYSGMTASGVSDPEVVALQQRLKTDGYFTGAVTGYFGPLTKSSLEKYQKANGLSPVGVVGPGTRVLLNKGI